MRICFIADAGSIHVKRIVSYYVNQKDEVLVLSTSARVADIPGAQVVHLIADKKSMVASSRRKRATRDVLVYGKRFIPQTVKAFVRRSIRHVNVLYSRELCVDHIRRFNPDVVFCNRSFPEGALASRCAFKPLLLRTAGQDISKFAQYPVYGQLIRTALRSADLVLTQSLWEENLLKRLCGEKIQIEISNIGIDVAAFQPQPERITLRSHYGLPQDAFVLVSNRFLTRPYNGWLVVEAVESLLESCPNLYLFYVFPWKLDARSKEKVEAITKRSPRIRFLEGPVAHSEMPDILNCGDAYVSFSSCDGIPNSLLEAMACGLVPIVAELPQLREWIDDGVDGYIVPQNDTRALALQVAQMYRQRDQLPRMATRCVEKIRARAAYEACSQKTRKLLEIIAWRSSRDTYGACVADSRES